MMIHTSRMWQSFSAMIRSLAGGIRYIHDEVLYFLLAKKIKSWLSNKQKPSILIKDQQYRESDIHINFRGFIPP